VQISVVLKGGRGLLTKLESALKKNYVFSSIVIVRYCEVLMCSSFKQHDTKLELFISD